MLVLPRAPHGFSAARRDSLQCVMALEDFEGVCLKRLVTSTFCLRRFFCLPADAGRLLNAPEEAEKENTFGMASGFSARFTKSHEALPHVCAEILRQKVLRARSVQAVVVSYGRVH